MTDTVLFEELPCRNGTRIGVATLNAPKSLNSLTLAMCEALDARLRQWADDPGVAVVLLQGAGEKAFCAGGDLQALYRSMQAHRGADPRENDYASRFFATEYRLDYLIHTYPKPVIVRGAGIVMGGGVGLMMGASHRVVFEDTRLAMPEISIGLFPDVGGSWLLNQAPGRTGLFMGLTGAQLGAADALFVGAADYHMASRDWPALMDRLLGLPWTEGEEAPAAPRTHANAARTGNDMLLHRTLLEAASAQPAEHGPLRRHQQLINNVCGQDTLEEIHARILALEGHEDPWLARAAATLKAGCPGSARLTYALHRHTRMMALAEVFRTEYWAALACTAHGDLAEGIRALIIDKDRQPRWNPATLAQADEQWVAKFLQPPWPRGQHPLADLGQDRGG